MRVEFAEDFEEDLAEIREDPISMANVEARIAEISGIQIQRNPYIGYEVEGGLRELVIGDKNRHQAISRSMTSTKSPTKLPTMRRMSPRG